MNVIIVGVLFVVLGTLAYVALRNAQDFSDANEVIPGVPTNAPKEWAGAHTPEARLHRRLRDAMTSLRTNRSLDDPAIAEAREALEREAVAVDDRLVAAASLPGRHKGDQLPAVASAVDAIEQAVAGVVALRGPTVDDVQRGIDQVLTRLSLVGEARRELETMTGPAPIRDDDGDEASGGAAPDPGPDTDRP